jgi:hypothetical protein
MGYTHYWYRQLKITPDKMRDIADDFAKIVLRLDDFGVHLAGGRGDGLPTITSEDISFNGPEKCGHPKNAEVMIPWPSDTASGVVDGKGEIAGHWFAGAVLDTRICNGDCSYETFSFPPTMDKSFLQKNTEHRGLFFECCKTAYRPYDLAVTAFLVIAKHHLQDRLMVRSDGTLQHWVEGIELCRTYLGYEEHYFFDAHGSLVPVAELPSDPRMAECGENYERCQHRASHHFPELAETASGDLPMRIWLHGWTPADLTVDAATAFIIHGQRYEKGGSAGDSTFGTWSRWHGRTYRGRPLWIHSLKGELPDYPVAVKYKTGMKPYPDVSWVFSGTKNVDHETIVGE